jgi:hypothetical protein
MKSWSVRVLTRVILLTKFPAHAAQNSSSSLSSSSLLPSSSNECRSLRATSRALPSDWELSRVSTGSTQYGLTTGSTLQQMAARIDETKQARWVANCTSQHHDVEGKKRGTSNYRTSYATVVGPLFGKGLFIVRPMENSSDTSPFPAAQKSSIGWRSGQQGGVERISCSESPGLPQQSLQRYRFIVGLLLCSHLAKPTFNYSRFGINGLFFVARCLKYSFGYWTPKKAPISVTLVASLPLDIV